MALLNRKPRPIARAELQHRDDRLIFVATEDTFAPESYFSLLREPRVQPVVLPSADRLSSPAHVVARLLERKAEAEAKHELLAGDEFWVVIDTDHWVQPNHKAGLVTALDEARRRGCEIAVSNPCFEFWLLLHHESPAQAYASCDPVGERLKQLLGGFNKRKLDPQHFPRGRMRDAIARARALEVQPDAPAGYWPEKNGSRVYRILERILRAD